jgi:hypothetical protein
MLNTAATHHGNANSDHDNRKCESTKTQQPTKHGVDAIT